MGVYITPDGIMALLDGNNHVSDGIITFSDGNKPRPDGITARIRIISIKNI